MSRFFFIHELFNSYYLVENLTSHRRVCRGTDLFIYSMQWLLYLSVLLM